MQSPQETAEGTECEEAWRKLVEGREGNIEWGCGSGGGQGQEEKEGREAVRGQALQREGNGREPAKKQRSEQGRGAGGQEREEKPSTKDETG